jgi:hypothetical protein
LVSALKELASLRTSGCLDENEFRAAKELLLQQTKEHRLPQQWVSAACLAFLSLIIKWDCPEARTATHSKLSSCLFQPDASQPPTANSQAVYSSQTPASHSQQTLKLSIPAGRQPATHSKLSSCPFFLEASQPSTANSQAVYSSRTPASHPQQTLKLSIPAGRQPATHSKLCNLLLLDELVDTLRESEVKRGRTCQPVGQKKYCK